MVTIKDIAQRAGVSFQLVSAVLGNKSYSHASAKTRQKIEQAAQELGYVPNASARVLQGGKSRLYGVLIDSQAPEVIFNLLSAIETVAAQRNYRILIAQAHNDPAKLAKAYIALKQNCVEGFISLVDDYPHEDCRLHDRLCGEKNLIFVGPQKIANQSFVEMSNYCGMKLAVEHLRQQGYQKIAIILPQILPGQKRNYASIEQRLLGFKKFCPQGKIFYCDYVDKTLSEIESQLKIILKNAINQHQIDSIIATNDYIAALVEKVALAWGIKIPEDLGIIGQDNRPICCCMPISLTTLNFNQLDIAQNIISYLQNNTDNQSKLQLKNYSPDLIVRDSTQRAKPKSTQTKSSVNLT